MPVSSPAKVLANGIREENCISGHGASSSHLRLRDASVPTG